MGSALRTVILVELLETLDLLLGFPLRDAVGFLKLAYQLYAFAGNHLKVVVSEVPPPRSHLAFELLPVAFDDVPVHTNLLARGTRLAEFAIDTSKARRMIGHGLYGGVQRLTQVPLRGNQSREWPAPSTSTTR